jgi:hypothetical protein
MSSCIIVSTPASKVNMSPAPSPSPRPTGLQIAAARKLASVFGHAWATDHMGPTDSELVNLGIAEADRLWGLREDAAEGAGAKAFLGLSPVMDEHGNLVHTSGSGTVSWAVEPCGAVQLTVRATVQAESGWGRQEGEVIYKALVVPSNPLAPVGALVGGMISPTSEWPEDGYAKDIGALALWALGFGPGSLEPWVRALPKPTLSAGKVRKL